MEQLTAKIKALVEQLGYYLYDIEKDKQDADDVFRVLIENNTYISIDDCVLVSKKLEELLDEIDPFTTPYMLEVTSAGAERNLRNDEEIKRAIGKHIFIKTVEQEFEGTLLSLKDDVVEVKVTNKKIAKVNLIDADIIRLAIHF